MRLDIDDTILNKILDKLQPQTVVKFHKHESLLKHIFLTRSFWRKNRKSLGNELFTIVNCITIMRSFLIVVITLLQIQKIRKMHVNYCCF